MRKLLLKKTIALKIYNIEINEQKLKERRFFSYVLNNLPADVVVFNAKHEYVFINRR